MAVAKNQKEYFHFPLMMDPMGCYVYDAENQIVFSTPNFVDDQRDLICRVVDVLNGDLNIVMKAHYSDEILHVKDIPLLLIRGWGYLTGTCRLTNQQAAGVQDDFGALCARILNGEDTWRK